MKMCPTEAEWQLFHVIHSVGLNVLNSILMWWKSPKTDYTIFGHGDDLMSTCCQSWHRPTRYVR